MAKAQATKEEKMVFPKKDGKYHYAVGKRKTSVATVRLYEKGKGDFLVNGKKLEDYLSSRNLAEVCEAPLRIVSMLKNFDITAKVEGGGLRGQADAIKHGIARALVKSDETLRPTLKKMGFLTRDPRTKERKKFGLKKARRAPQWSKR